ncbi:MFS transporter [Streptomyces lydicus]|nr:MFS transporter [Streptomyces lydicus]
MTETRTPAVPAPRTAPATRPVPVAPTAPPPPVREIWFAAWPVVALFILSNAAMPLYGVWQHQLGFGSGTLTLVYAAYVVGLLGTLLVAGVASDRLGRKPVLVPALLLGIVACLVYATAPSVAALAAARLLTGIATGAAVSAGMAAVTDLAAGRTLGPLLASTGMVLGAGIGPVLAGVLSETAPAPTVTVFGVEAVLLATALAVVARMPLPRSRPGRDARAASLRPPAPPVPGCDCRPSPGQPPPSRTGAGRVRPGHQRHRVRPLAGTVPADRAARYGEPRAGGRHGAGDVPVRDRRAVRAAPAGGPHRPARLRRRHRLRHPGPGHRDPHRRPGTAARLGGPGRRGPGRGAARRADAAEPRGPGPSPRGGQRGPERGRLPPRRRPPVADGYLSDALGLPTAATLFGLAVAALAAAGRHW